MELKRRNAKGNVVTDGRRIDFLGYCFTHQNTLLRKSMKKNFARKCKRVTNPKRKQEIIAAYWGWCKWANCTNLWNKLTKDKNDMSFAEKGITSRRSTKDGQRYFDVKKIKTDTILNLPITVIDFEPGVKTKHGENRYVIKIIKDGQEYKIITNSYTLKDKLEQAKEINAFPIDTVLRKHDLGDGKSDYDFD